MENSANIKEFTRLPATEIVRGDSAGRALHLVTPHKGEVVIEYHEQGMFREKNREMGKVLGQIRALEDEARDYLLGQWITRYYQPPPNP